MTPALVTARVREFAASRETTKSLLDVDGRLGWLGSANATAGVGDQVDWAMRPARRHCYASSVRLCRLMRVATKPPSPVVEG